AFSTLWKSVVPVPARLPVIPGRQSSGRPVSVTDVGPSVPRMMVVVAPAGLAVAESAAIHRSARAPGTSPILLFIVTPFTCRWRRAHDGGAQLARVGNAVRVVEGRVGVRVEAPSRVRAPVDEARAEARQSENRCETAPVGPDSVEAVPA